MFMMSLLFKQKLMTSWTSEGRKAVGSVQWWSYISQNWWSADWESPGPEPWPLALKILSRALSPHWAVRGLGSGQGSSRPGSGGSTTLGPGRHITTSDVFRYTFQVPNSTCLCSVFTFCTAKSSQYLARVNHRQAIIIWYYNWYCFSESWIGTYQGSSDLVR